MTSDPIWRRDATGLSDLLALGEISPSQVLDVYLARIKALEPRLNAFAHLDIEGARVAAASADERQQRGERLGPLDGIPVVIKDNLYVAGQPASWGSHLFADFVPEQDDICVARLRAAGAVIIGKTNTPEFALSGHTTSPRFGTTRSPWDTSLTPGGSSGGAAAAVSAGLVPVAIGTDAGGSIRTPAAYTGLLGLRPANGRVPRRHGFPPMAIDFQAIGLLARTTRDIALLLDVMGGSDPRDPVSMLVPPMADVPRAALRIGWFDQVGDERSDPEVAASLAAVLEQIGGLGHAVRQVSPPFDLAQLRSVWPLLSAAGVARVARRDPQWREKLSPAMAELAEKGLALPAADYVDALDRLQTFRADASAQWGEYDLLVTPTTPAPAWPVDQDAPALIGGRPGNGDTQGMFCGWVNAMGFAGLSMPGPAHSDGRPIGIQLVARPPGDRLIVRMAADLERLTAWHDCWPALAMSV
ncbi:MULTISPECIES: amidase [Devosia]|uniref:amidase n=1 Tax=Devosia TaxID=46913 RepID=UPI000CE95883|nr:MULTISPECIES: amidase [Devosia]AVF04350.1 amidase [Devosia sp. I507]